MKLEYIDVIERKGGTSYRVKIPYYENGTRKFYSRYFNTKDYGNSKQYALNEAKNHRDKMKIELTYQPVISQKKYLDDIFTLFLDISSVSPRRKDKYRTYYNRYIKPYINHNIEFKNITIKDIQPSINSLVDKSQDTINSVITTWTKMYDVAIKNDLCVKDVSRLIEKPKSTKPIVTKEYNITYDEIDDVIFNIKNSNIVDKEQLCNAVLIGWYLGLRPGEIFGIQKECIHTDTRTIDIMYNVRLDKDRKPYLAVTKTGKSNRTIPYPEELDKVFNNWIGFVRENGYLWDSTSFGNAIRKRCPNFNLYKERHQFATDLLYNNVDIRTVQELMGHSSSSMTLAYARSDMDKYKDAIKKR